MRLAGGVAALGTPQGTRKVTPVGRQQDHTCCPMRNVAVTVASSRPARRRHHHHYAFPSTHPYSSARLPPSPSFRSPLIPSLPTALVLHRISSGCCGVQGGGLVAFQSSTSSYVDQQLSYTFPTSCTVSLQLLIPFLFFFFPLALSSHIY